MKGGSFMFMCRALFFLGFVKSYFGDCMTTHPVIICLCIITCALQLPVIRIVTFLAMQPSISFVYIIAFLMQWLKYDSTTCFFRLGIYHNNNSNCRLVGGHWHSCTDAIQLLGFPRGCEFGFEVLGKKVFSYKISTEINFFLNCIFGIDGSFLVTLFFYSVCVYICNAICASHFSVLVAVSTLGFHKIISYITQ